MQRGSLADLTAFIAVADHRSFRSAASRLGVTPSALSHSMRQLEERLGMRLLHRTTRSVSPTDAGLRLLERLRPAIDQIADALEETQSCPDREGGHDRDRPRGPGDRLAPDDERARTTESTFADGLMTQVTNAGLRSFRAGNERT